MVPHSSPNGLNIVAIVGALVFAWYVYQIASRKREVIRYKIRRIIIAIAIYVSAAILLISQGLPPVEAVLFAALASLGLAWLLVKTPRPDRRIPKGIRAQVIARDLTSK